MNKILSIDSKFSAIVSKILALAILNILWLFSLLTIVMGGVGTTAVFYCLFKYRKQGDINIWMDFKKSWKQNFCQSTLAWLCFLLFGIFLLLDYYILFGLKLECPQILIIVIGFISVCYMLAMLYFFPLLAKFHNTNGNLLKMSLYIGIKHIFKSLSLLGILGAVIFLSTCSARLIPIWILLGYSTSAYVASGIYLRIFKLYGDDTIY